MTTSEQDERAVAAGAGQPPKVVIFDTWGASASPDVVEVLERAGCRVEVSSARAEDDVISAVQDADGIIYTGRISRRFMESLTRCRVLARTSIGMDAVDGIDVATSKGVVLCNMPLVIEEDVADHAMALLFACARRIHLQDRGVRDGAWPRGSVPGTDGIPRLYDSSLGIVGLGNIGRAVARRAKGFGMRVRAADPYVPAETFEREGVRRASLVEVLQDSDFVSLHVPLSDETRHLIGDRELRLMPARTMLVNTSRGAVVDEAALVAALQEGRLAGAGLDVMEEEPIGADHPLCGLDNVVLTPHSASRAAVTDRERHIRPAQEVAAVLAGHRPRAVWNPEVLEGLQLR
jgi:D-3-phosphoglycerate dehydrogenase / 2-oxoglutarate reductase